MTKITLIVGLPGSGKTTLGKQLESQGSYFIDDISISGIDVLQEAIKVHDHVVVADIFLCREKERQRAIRFLKDCEIEWVFFENDPIKCLANVKQRNDGRKVEGMVQQLSKEYIIPDGAILLSVQNK